MYHNHRFSNGHYDGFESSDSILQAIEDVAGCEFDLNNPDACPAYKIWADPTPRQAAEVARRAWKYEDESEGGPEWTHLNWGVERIHRPHEDGRWYRFGGDNLQTIYAYGTADEASRYQDRLNKGRDSNHYSYAHASDEEARQCENGPHLQEEAYDLADALAQEPDDA